MFVTRSEAGPYPYDNPNPEPRAREIVPFLITANGQLGSIPAVSFGSDDGYGWWPSLVARGSRTFLAESNEMTVVDASNPTAPTLVTHEMPRYYCSSLQVSGDTAYCAMNQYGVTTFGL